MKPTLLIGLGNPLMGDDAVGQAVAARVASDSRLPEDVEVVCGGTDLLRYAGRMEGRSRVIVIDALEDDAEPGSIMVFDGAARGLDDRQEHAHHLSAVQCLRLLQMTVPARFTLLGISVPSVRMESQLSDLVERRMAAMVDRVFQEIRWTSST